MGCPGGEIDSGEGRLESVIKPPAYGRILQRDRLPGPAGGVASDLGCALQRPDTLKFKPTSRTSSQLSEISIARTPAFRTRSRRAASSTDIGCANRMLGLPNSAIVESSVETFTLWRPLRPALVAPRVRMNTRQGDQSLPPGILKVAPSSRTASQSPFVALIVSFAWRDIRSRRSASRTSGLFGSNFAS